MSSQQKGAGAGNKAGTSEEEQADAFMQEIAKREVSLPSISSFFLQNNTNNI